MSGPVIGSPVSAPPLAKLKNKRVLLVDTSSSKRDLRADSMRKLGMEVDCAADISEARSWWRADLYSLVLIDMENGLGRRDKFCDEMRQATPPQQISFFIGKPGYFADVPNAEEIPLVLDSGAQTGWGDVKAALAADLPVDLPGGVPQRWGLLEASRRISAVRSLSHARSKASHASPAPAREFETKETKRITAESRTLDDLLREEMQ